VRFWTLGLVVMLIALLIGVAALQYHPKDKNLSTINVEATARILPLTIEAPAIPVDVGEQLYAHALQPNPRPIHRMNVVEANARSGPNARESARQHHTNATTNWRHPIKGS